MVLNCPQVAQFGDGAELWTGGMVGGGAEW